jgi:hypothetical protein
MKQLLKKINWKKVGITLLIIYVILWSYIFLAIQYAEHRINTIEKVINSCAESDKCVDIFKKYSVSTQLFNPILGY